VIGARACGGAAAGGCAAEQHFKREGGIGAAAVAGVGTGNGTTGNTDAYTGPVYAEKSNDYKRRMAGENWV
jgi:hypothetical protein